MFEVLAYATATIALALTAGISLVKLGFPLPDRSRQLSIDGLRGILATSVLVHHAWIWRISPEGGWSAPAEPLANQLGAGAVGLFFMTTGYLFYRKILSLSVSGWLNMMVGRVFRIYPLVAVSFAAILLIVLYRAQPEIELMPLIRSAALWISARQEVPILGYADSGRINAFVLWSLWQEWMFYALMIPALGFTAWALRRSGAPRATLPIGLIALGFIAQAALPGSLHSARFWPLFGAGMLAAEFAGSKYAQMLARPAAGAIAVALLAIACTFTRDPYGVGFPAFAFFFTCVASGNAIGGLLNNRAVRALGECSFGIYLFHGVVLSIAFADIGVPIDAPIAPLAILVTVAIVAPLYLIVERPMDRVGHRVRGMVVDAPRSLALWLARKDFVEEEALLTSTGADANATISEAEHGQSKAKPVIA
ncbi:acyltransferase family protein [Sphingomonas sp. R1]|uniref:acyltransferase family protein n=1 Tax=Sphingomonas sp. R1 TaxID=399176 RepID=UPI0022245AC1|nr:acyltransferase [Sphingomonas sp. R1]UYY77813.1 acyltransferase [Sphingomonas sp. R1]